MTTKTKPLKSNRAYKKRKGSLVHRLFANKKLTVMMVFVLLFAGIGSYILITSHAAYPFFYIEQDEYNKINLYRASKGVGQLASTQCLSEQARAWADWMAAGHFGHSDNLAQYGKCFANRVGLMVGENINRTLGPYTGFPDNDWEAAQAEWTSFLNSQHHEENIRNPGWHFMGVGIGKAGDGSIYIVQVFTAECSAGCGPAVGPSQVDPQTYVSLAIKPGATSGFAIDNYGDMTGFNRSNAPAGAGYWPFHNVVRAAAVNRDGYGYKLDKFGGLWPFSGAPTPSGGPYWNNWDIARDVKLIGATTRGYVLDGLGGLSPFNGAPGGVIPEGKWSSDTARRFAINRAGTQGYVMDYFGGLHPFSTPGHAWLPKPTNGNTFYWPNSKNTARTVVLRNDGDSTYDGRQGYVLDSVGGIHPFATGGRCKPASIKSPYYQPLLPIATDLVITRWGTCTTPSKGYVLLSIGVVKGF